MFLLCLAPFLRNYVFLLYNLFSQLFYLLAPLLQFFLRHRLRRERTFLSEILRNQRHCLWSVVEVRISVYFAQDSLLGRARVLRVHQDNGSVCQLNNLLHPGLRNYVEQHDRACIAGNEFHVNPVQPWLFGSGSHKHFALALLNRI